MKVLVADKFEKIGLIGLASLGCEVVNEPTVGAERLLDAVVQFDPDVLIVRSSKVTAAVLAAAKKLRLVIRAGAGVDNIDVGAATSKGVKVCNTPGMNAIAVAELTMGLMLSIDRRIPDQVAALRSGQWNKKDFGKTGIGGARGLKGLTLGMVGVGAIGQEVVKRAKAFGMHVISWSRNISLQHAAALEVEWCGENTPELIELLQRSDVVSVHLPLTDTTKKLFNKQMFDAMRPGAYFINTSRGGIVDEAALREAVKDKGLRVGLDVWENQPAEGACAWDSPTAKVPGVYGTCHSGASTDQAQNAVAEEAVRVVKVFMASGRAENCVNP